jgi:hypothetical protein
VEVQLGPEYLYSSTGADSVELSMYRSVSYPAVCDLCGEVLTILKTYHDWMKSPELLELTASEPLSLEEEYDMQRELEGGYHLIYMQSRG